MNTPLPGMVVDIEARIDKLEKSLKKANQLQGRSATAMERRAKQSADRMRTSYEQAGNGIGAAMTKMGKAGIAGLVAGLGVGSVAAITRTVSGLASSIAGIGDAAKMAGVETDDFQRWKFVAEQNRIGIDAMTDGLKELSLRADEFVTTGKGSAAEAFIRLGLTGDQLAEKLKNPSDLLLEIFGRLKDLDRAAQIRVADEVFGGSGGEQFVALIAQGEDGIRATMDRAGELGYVLDASVIERAAEIDRRFNELKATTGSWAKGFVVDLAEAMVEMTDFRDKLDDLFPSEDQGRAVLGNEVYDALAADRDSVDESALEIARLRQQFVGLGEDSLQAAAALEQAAILAGSWGYAEASAQIAQAAQDMRDLSGEFQDGKVEGEAFAEGLNTIQQSAADAFDTLDQSDRVDFSAAISEVGRLGGAIASAITLANSLRSAIASAANITVTGPTGPMQDADRAGSLASQRQARVEREALDAFTAAEDERNSKTRDRLTLEREIADVQTRAAEAGVTLTAAQAEATAQAAIAAEAARAEAAKAAGAADKKTGGGGSDKLDEFSRAVEAIKAETLALETEALALALSAEAGEDYAAAIDLARQKADLLNAALASGRADSPALRSEIDALTGSYADLAAANDATKAKIDATRAAQEQFGQIAEGAFVGLVTGAMSFREALSSVASQLAQMAASKAFVGLMSGGGTAGKIGKFLGYAEGGFTGPGGKYEPAGLVHKGEFVMSKAATERIGVGSLQALHTGALKGYSAGGYVGPALAAPALAAPVQTAPQININNAVTVNGSAGTPSQNTDLAKQMAREMENSMRGVVMSEIQRQSRPGNMMGRK